MVLWAGQSSEIILEAFCIYDSKIHCLSQLSVSSLTSMFWQRRSKKECERDGKKRWRLEHALSNAKRIWIWQSDNKFHCWLSRSQRLPQCVCHEQHVAENILQKDNTKIELFYARQRSVCELWVHFASVNNWLGLKHHCTIRLFSVTVVISCESSKWFVVRISVPLTRKVVQGKTRG